MSKTMKYVRTQLGFAVFPVAAGMHSDVARSLARLPMSAGFIDWIDGLPVCHGRSESLNLGAGPDDTAALRAEWGMEFPVVADEAKGLSVHTGKDGVWLCFNSSTGNSAMIQPAVHILPQTRGLVYAAINEWIHDRQQEYDANAAIAAAQGDPL